MKLKKQNIFLSPDQNIPVNHFFDRLQFFCANKLLVSFILYDEYYQVLKHHNSLARLSTILIKNDISLILDHSITSKIDEKVIIDGWQYPFKEIQNLPIGQLNKKLNKKQATKNQLMIGISDITTRHDAMIAGEKEIDYLLFGNIQNTTSIESNETSNIKRSKKWIELAHWWADIFEIPCILVLSKSVLGLDKRTLDSQEEENVKGFREKVRSSQIEFLAYQEGIWQDEHSKEEVARTLLEMIT